MVTSTGSVRRVSLFGAVVLLLGLLWVPTATAVDPTGSPGEAVSQDSARRSEAPTSVAPTPEASTPEASTPVAPTPEPSTPVAPTPEASTPAVSALEVPTPEVSFPVPDPDEATDAAGSMGITVTPDGRVAPGQSAPFVLSISNTGRSAIPDLVVEDVLPAGLSLVDVTGQPAGTQYLITYTLPSGTPEPARVDFTATKDPDDPARVARARWSFPGWDFTPGAEVAIAVQARLAPGTSAGVTFTNAARSTSGGQDVEFTCSHDDSQRIGGQLFCTSEADVAVLVEPSAQDALADDVRPGRVAVRAMVTGTPPAGLELPPFPVDYQCMSTQEQPGGSSGPAEVVASGTVLVPGGQTLDVPELLPAGATCSFWVTDTHGAVSDSTSRDTAQQIVVEPASPESGAGQAPAQVVEITTDYPVGSLELTGALTGSGAQFADGPSDFEVSCTFLDAQTVDEQVRLTAPDDLTATVEGINVGAQCTITQAQPFDGADGPASFAPEGPYLITGADSGPVSVTATSQFTAGQLVIEKVVENADPEIGPFTVHATCVDRGGAPVELPDGGQVELYGGDQVSADVPLGSTCTVTEPDLSDAIEVIVEDSDPDTEGGDTDGVVVIDASAPIGYVTITNVFPDGLLVIGKQVKNADPESGPFTFQVTCVAQDGSAVELPDGGRLELSGEEVAGAEVPPGSTCRVVETDVRDGVSVSMQDSDPSTIGGATDGVVVFSEPITVHYVLVTNRFADVIAGGGDQGEELAETGAEGAMAWLLVGLGLVLTGGMLTTLSRRRRIV